MLLNEVGVDDEVAGGTQRVLGLSDLVQAAGGDVACDLCYVEDIDNQVDIVVEGDDAAVQSITHVSLGLNEFCDRSLRKVVITTCFESRSPR